ncbi:MAG: NAD-dependent epimerase/dehydratase family protein [Candidatus Kapaibacterium sp.]
MKALVTGATGFIGSHVADQLLGRGYEVRCTIRKTSSLRWLKDKPIELVEASLSDKASLIKAVEGVDYIVHIAGLTAARNYEEFLLGNRDCTRNLVEAATEAAPGLKRFLFMSSQTVAGPSPAFDRPVTEDQPARPLTAYAKSKLAAEEEVRKASGRIPITIVRPPAVYGPRDTAIYPVFQAVNRGVGTLIGMKPKYVSLIHGADLARGTIDCLESDKTVGEMYYISSEQFYTWPQLIGWMQQAAGAKVVVKLKLPHFLVLAAAGMSEFFGRFQKKPPVFNYEKGIDFIQSFWTCSVGKARRDFGWQQKISAEEGIHDTVGWYKEQGWMK